MTGNPIGDDGLSSLCKVLSSLPHLQELRLANVGISATGLQNLADVTKPSPDGQSNVLQVYWDLIIVIQIICACTL